MNAFRLLALSGITTYYADGARMVDIRNWRKWRQGKKKRSESARRAVLARWERYHATKLLEPTLSSIPDPCYRLTIENFVTGQSHVLVFHPANKLNRFAITVDDKDWTICRWSKALVKVRKSCVRMVAV